jgi:hypothetical protein
LETVPGWLSQKTVVEEKVGMFSALCSEGQG